MESFGRDILREDSLFGKTDWLAAGIVALIALTIYFVTLAPGVTLAQSGAFAVAGQYSGIGRVPGYPLWHFLAKFFISIFGFVRYRGCSNPAWATNFMSAFFGALSCGIVALLVARVGRAIASPQGGSKAKSLVAALSAGVLFAVSHAMWSQSVITETHTLTLFCILAFLLSSFVWLYHPGRCSACIFAAVFGLGLAQSHIIFLLLPVFLIAILFAEPRLCREFCIASALIWLLPIMLFNTDFAKPWFFFAFALSVILGVVLPLYLSKFGGTAILMLIIITLGVSLYLYLPLASEGKAPMQFGYARTWAGFMHVVTRGQYERIRPTDVLTLRFLGQLRWTVGVFCQQYIVPLVFVAFLPLIRISRFRGLWLKWWGICLLTFFILSVALLVGINPKCDIQDSFIQRVKFIPSFAIWGIFTGLGFLMVLDWISRHTEDRFNSCE